MSDNLPRMDYRQHRRGAAGWYMSAVTTTRGTALLLDDGEALRVRPEHFPFPHVPLVPCGCPCPLTGSCPQPSYTGGAGNGVPSAERPLSPNPTGGNTAPTAPGA